MQKNTAGQKFLAYAWTLATGAAKTGDAANITGKVRKDFGAATAITDTNPTELESGYYEFDATQAETNADTLDVIPVSATAGVQVIGVPGRIFTVPAGFAAGTGAVNVAQWLGTAVDTPTVAGVPNVNAKTWNDLATVALPLAPTTAGRTLDVTATGAAGIDWANVEAPTTTLDLSNTTVKTATDIATLLAYIESGTAQAGAASTITLRSGANANNDYYKYGIVEITSGTGAGQGNIIQSYVGATKVATLSSNWTTPPDSSSVYRIRGFGAVPGATAPTAAQVADAVWDEARADHTTVGSFGEGVNLDGITTAGKALVQTEANDALVDNNLDHLLKVAAVAGDAVDSSIVARLASKSATPSFASFVNTTDSHEALADAVAAVGTPLDAAGVRAAVGLASDNLDAQLAAGLAQANKIDSAATTAPASATTGSLLDRLANKDGSKTYDATTDSLEAVRDKINTVAAKTDSLTFTTASKVDAKLTADGLDNIVGTATASLPATYPEKVIDLHQILAGGRFVVDKINGTMTSYAADNSTPRWTMTYVSDSSEDDRSKAT